MQYNNEYKLKKGLKNLFLKFDKSKKKVHFLLANIVNLDLKNADVKLGKQVGKGLFGKVFILKNKKDRVVKLIGKGYAKSTYEKLNLAVLNNNLFERNVIMCSKYIVDTFIESFNLFKAEKSRLTPKFYDFYLVEHNGKIYPAIEMQKINGTSFLNFFYQNGKDIIITKEGRIQEKNNFSGAVHDYQVVKCFRRLKFKHNDLHLGNIMLTYTGKIKVLDFSPEFIGHRTKSNERYKVFIVNTVPKFSGSYKRISKLNIKFT
jgi:serine/threonine protein kinase